MAPRTYIIFSLCCAFIIIGIMVNLLQKPLFNNFLKNDTISSSKVDQSSVIIKNVTLREYDKDNQFEVHITSETGTFDHMSDYISCDNVTCNVTDHTHKKAQLTSKKSLIDRHEKTIIFQGTVKGIFQDVTINGLDVTYNFSTNIISTEQPMTYNHCIFDIYAHKSIVNLHTQTITFFDGVRTEISYGSTTNNSTD